ncbi:hypothetical protein PVAND_014016 [Polypedilum vanderplanki]|uniref:RING-type E3 ubiquitin transferase n=1 Tax=Polypedilum vanderplanki TaxID=319348 RepID=A0A9J6CT78_POLVA|nr:hypothetical protein PVAND_014016 [Polypedilum vanderplanki]
MDDTEENQVENENPEVLEVTTEELTIPIPDVVSPSKKKRKLESPMKLPNLNLIEDDGSICSICLDNFHSSGPHRLISLSCGHLYGESCITTWLKDQKNCPQCKKKASAREFRPIFATRIQIIDNSREMELELKIQKLENDKRNLILTNESDKLTIAVQKRQITDLKKELECLKKLALPRNNLGTECIQTIRSGRMYLDKNIDFKENSECRAIKFMSKAKKLVLSQKIVGTTLWSGYGVRFIDAVTYKGERFLNVSAKPVIDLSFDMTDSFISCCSRESMCKVFNCNTGQNIATMSTNVPIWSCSFNKNLENQVLLGGQDGHVYVYDLKRPIEPLIAVTSLGSKTPVKFILSINKTENFPFGGFFIIHVRGLYLYECQADLDFKVTKLNFEDSIVSASYDNKTEMILISTPGEDQTTHILMRLIKADEVPVLQEIYRIHSNQGLTSRPTQIKVPDGFVVTSYSNREIQVHTPSIGRVHSVPMPSLVNDFCAIYNDSISPPTFAALSSNKCRIYKVNLEYT